MCVRRWRLRQRCGRGRWRCTFWRFKAGSRLAAAHGVRSRGGSACAGRCWWPWRCWWSGWPRVRACRSRLQWWRITNMPLEPILLTYAADKLAQYCGRIETCVDKLTPEQIWTRNSENANAIGNLVLHLSGNVRQWILHGVGGEPDTRQRDTAFAARGGLD